jgi:hypothetical protein
MVPSSGMINLRLKDSTLRFLTALSSSVVEMIAMEG